MKIGIDFDDCIADFAPFLIDYYNKIDGTSHKIEDVTSWELDGLWKMDIKSARDRCFNFYPQEVGIEIPPVHGAVQAIQKLKEKNELIIITGRPEATLSFVVDWLKKHSLDVFSKIIFSDQFNGEKRKKAEICKDEKVDIFIDDSLKNILDISKEGIKCFLIDTPWNQGELPENVKRVKGWGEIVKGIKVGV